MKIVGKIFTVIGGIMSFVTGFVGILLMLLFIALSISSVSSYVYDGIKSVATNLPFDIMPYVDQMMTQSVTIAIVYAIIGAFYFVAGAIAMTAARKNSQGLFIVTLVFGVLTGSIIMFLGGLFGAIGTKKKA